MHRRDREFVRRDVRSVLERKRLRLGFGKQQLRNMRGAGRWRIRRGRRRWRRSHVLDEQRLHRRQNVLRQRVHRSRRHALRFVVHQLRGLARRGRHVHTGRLPSDVYRTVQLRNVAELRMHGGSHLQPEPRLQQRQQLRRLRDELRFSDQQMLLRDLAGRRRWRRRRGVHVLRNESGRLRLQLYQLRITRLRRGAFAIVNET